MILHKHKNPPADPEHRQAENGRVDLYLHYKHFRRKCQDVSKN